MVQGVVLVYDAGDRRSFHNVTRWMADIKQHATEQNVVVMLVANKVDLPAEKRLVSAEMGRQLAEEIGQGPLLLPLPFPLAVLDIIGNLYIIGIVFRTVYDFDISCAKYLLRSRQWPWWWYWWLLLL